MPPGAEAAERHPVGPRGRRPTGRAGTRRPRVQNGAVGTGERAHYWRHPAVPGVDLMRARFVRHTFARHTHESYVIAAVTEGVEEFHHRGGVERAVPGTVALINPDTAHTGHAGVPEGWSYRVLYPAPEVVRRVAAEVAPVRGTPAFRDAVVGDARAAELVTAVHRAVELDDALTAATMLRLALARLLGAGGEAPRARRPRAAGASAAARARDILQHRMARPPGLEELAGEVGTAPFPLLRAFRDAYGLPPHTWLTGARVRRARALLDAGVPPARAAAEVGFHDQPHLNRHFTRILGVPPGVYQRAVLGAPAVSRWDRGGPAPDRKNVQDRSPEPLLR
jgi:AraC-like DNA-binding protein